MSYYVFHILLTYAHILFLYVSINMTHTQLTPPPPPHFPTTNGFFSWCHTYCIVVTDKFSCTFSKTIVQKLFIQEWSWSMQIWSLIWLRTKASSILKETFPGVQGFPSLSVRRFCSERSISSGVFTEKVTEMVMEASSKVISTF